MELLRERFIVSLYVIIVFSLTLIVTSLLSIARIPYNWMSAILIPGLLTLGWWSCQTASMAAAARSALEMLLVFTD